jgi:hypothetical protein
VEYSDAPINGVLSAWMRNDAEAVLDWLQQLSDGPKKQAIVARTLSFETAGEIDSAIIVNLATMLPEGWDRDRALGECAKHFAERDPAAAVAWVSAQTDAGVKSVMLSDMIRSLSGDNLRDALAEVARLNGNGAQRVDFSSLKDDYVRDLPALAAWAAKQSENQQYVNDIAANWARSQPERTDAWLASLSAPTRDGALQAVVQSSQDYISGDSKAMHEQFEKIAHWAAQITDPEIRTSAYEGLARSWLRWEPESAHTWIPSAPLPQSLKAQLLAPKAKAAGP